MLRVLSPVDCFSVVRRSGQDQARVLSLVSKVVGRTLFRKVNEAYSTMAVLDI